jgi:hypothetical protein
LKFVHFGHFTHDSENDTKKQAKISNLNQPPWFYSGLKKPFFFHFGHFTHDSEKNIKYITIKTVITM